MRHRFTPAEWEELKRAYIEKYGYTIVVPGWDDIIRWEPTLAKTEAQIRAEKRAALERILASPAVDWQRSYATVMTIIDNIQDTASVVYPMFRMLVRWAPKIFARFIPVMGWMLLGYDILNLLNAWGRAPWTIMAGKRSLCNFVKSNPFSKHSQWKRTIRIKNWDPRIPDLIQVAQTTQQFTGVGLQLGSIVGFIQDLGAGVYRKITGDRVTISTEVPRFNPYELHAQSALKAAAIINSSGETFSEDVHFYAYMTGAAASMIMTPLNEVYDFPDMLPDATEAIIDAPRPTNPYTIEAVKNAGLNLERGIQWPMNAEKQIKLLDLSRYIQENARDSFLHFAARHQYDSYGLIAGKVLADSTEDMIDSLVPEAEYIEEDAPHISVMFAMQKTPILPVAPPSENQRIEFNRWIDDFVALYEQIPKTRDIKDKLDAMGIEYKTAYPTSLDPAVAHLFPEDQDFLAW